MKNNKDNTIIYTFIAHTLHIQVYTTEFILLLLYNANENEILMWNVCVQTSIVIVTYVIYVQVLYPLSLLFIGILINYTNAYGLIHCYNVQNYISYLYIHQNLI